MGWHESEGNNKKEESFKKLLSLVKEVKEGKITNDEEINNILIAAITYGEGCIEWEGRIEKLQNGKRIYIVCAKELLSERGDNQSLQVIDFSCKYNMSCNEDGFDIEEFFDRDNPVVFHI